MEFLVSGERESYVVAAGKPQKRQLKLPPPFISSSSLTSPCNTHHSTARRDRSILVGRHHGECMGIVASSFNPSR